MKDELEEKIMTEFVALRRNTYFYLRDDGGSRNTYFYLRDDGGSNKKAKGTKNV